MIFIFIFVSIILSIDTSESHILKNPFILLTTLHLEYFTGKSS